MSQKALVVGDNVETIGCALEFGLDYDVETAASLEEAKKYKNTEFDLILIEGRDRECFEVFQLLKGKRKIIYTEREETIVRARASGIEAHLKGELQDLLRII